MLPSQYQVVPLLGRVLMLLLFAFAGYNKLTHFDNTVAYIAKAGMPLPMLCAVGAVVVELGGSICLLLGWRVRVVACIMALFTIVSAFYFHKFWAAAPEAYGGQFNNFFKNVSICGGLMYMLAFGAGPFSLDQRRVPTV